MITSFLGFAVIPHVVLLSPVHPQISCRGFALYCAWHFCPQDYLTNPFSNPKFTTVFIPIDNYQLPPCAGWEMSTSQSAMMLYG